MFHCIGVLVHGEIVTLLIPHLVHCLIFSINTLTDKLCSYGTTNQEKVFAATFVTLVNRQRFQMCQGVKQGAQRTCCQVRVKEGESSPLNRQQIHTRDSSRGYHNVGHKRGPKWKRTLHRLNRRHIQTTIKAALFISPQPSSSKQH